MSVPAKRHPTIPPIRPADPGIGDAPNPVKTPDIALDPSPQPGADTGDLDEKAVKRVRRRLLAWGADHGQRFPWRTETNPWLTLVAELLLQRTRASQVDPVYRDFAARFPRPETLVAAGSEAAQAVTARLGIHWRGPLLYRLAVVCADHGGRPPEDEQVLRGIPGIGPYTAAAWLSLHRGHRAAIVDANVARWLARMTGRSFPRDPRHIRWVNDLADRLTPRRAFRAYNYAVLDFTMTVCLPRAPRCATCPLHRDCRFGSDQQRTLQGG